MDDRFLGVFLILFGLASIISIVPVIPDGVMFFPALMCILIGLAKAFSDER